MRTLSFVVTLSVFSFAAAAVPSEIRPYTNLFEAAIRTPQPAEYVKRLFELWEREGGFFEMAAVHYLRRDRPKLDSPDLDVYMREKAKAVTDLWVQRHFFSPRRLELLRHKIMSELSRGYSNGSPEWRFAIFLLGEQAL